MNNYMRVFFSACALCVSVSSLFAADDLPQRLNFDRYQGMLEHSPFAVASAVVAPAATPSACKDLFIANAAKSADGDMVTIGSTVDKEFKKYLTTKNPVDGYSIANIEWSDKVGETKVTISKDGQFCTLTFNQALLSQPVPNKPVPGFMPPAAPLLQPGLQKPIPTPVLPVPTPHVRGVIPRNPQTPAPAFAPSAPLPQKKQPDRDDDGTLPQGL